MESGFQVWLPTGITWGTFRKHWCQALPQWIQLFWMSGCVREINRAGYPAFPEGLLKRSLFTVKNVACSSSFNPISEHVGSDGSKTGYCKYTCASATKARSEEASNYSWTDGPLPSIILVCRHTRKWPESNSKTTQSHPWVLCQFTSVCGWTQHHHPSLD